MGADVQTLVLEIDVDDLALIRAAGLRIILARATGDDQPVVVWQSLDPFQINTVTWPEQAWALYAATAALAPGNKVLMVSRLPDAQAGHYYSFTASAAFAGPYLDASIADDAYGVHNAMPSTSNPALTFGLALAAELNGTAVEQQPANGVMLLSTRLAVLAPAATVYAWLEAGLASGMVLAQSSPLAAKLDYTRARELTLRYDPDRGGFVLTPPTS